MPVSDVKRLLCASLVAEILLEGRTDLRGRPLIEHARRVMVRCAQKGLSADQRVAAVLHDCIGEARDFGSDATVRDSIYLFFGPDVYDLVNALTRRYREQYTLYVRRVSETPLAAPIKLADLEDNLDPSRGPVPDSLRQRYERARGYLRSVQPPTEETP